MFPNPRLYHVGRVTGPFYWWTPPPLINLGSTAGRFDDAAGLKATLYCATRPYGALLEKLMALRPKPGLAALINQSVPDGEPEPLPAFPTELLIKQTMTSAVIDPKCRFIDVDDPRNHRFLEQQGGKQLLDHLDVSRIDRGTFLSPNRNLTRLVARELFEISGDAVHGLRFSSALDENVECWALWERAKPYLQDLDTVRDLVIAGATRLRSV